MLSADDETMSQTPSDENNFRMLWFHHKHSQLALESTSPICVDSQDDVSPQDDVFNHGSGMEDEQDDVGPQDDVFNHGGSLEEE